MFDGYPENFAYQYSQFYNYSAAFFTHLETNLFFGSLYPVFYFLKKQHTTWFFNAKFS